MAEELVLISKIKYEKLLTDLEKQTMYLSDIKHSAQSGSNTENSSKDIQLGGQKDNGVKSNKITDVQKQMEVLLLLKELSYMFRSQYQNLTS